MPRKPRQVSLTGVYHFISRGVNKKKIFHSDRDFTFYKALLKEYSVELSIEIYHYALMGNHLHLLLKAPELPNLSRFGHLVNRRYAYYYCKIYRWPEQVFRKRFTSIPVTDDAYLLECGRYIERNPLKAKMVKSLADYPHTSYAFYANGNKDSLVSASPGYLALSKLAHDRKVIYRQYINQTRATEIESPELTCPF